MRVDFKVTAWEQMDHIPEEYKEKILEELKSGRIATSAGLFEFIENNLDPDAAEYGGVTAETEQQLHPSENENFATIEFYDDDDNLIWANGKVYFHDPVPVEKPKRLYPQYICKSCGSSDVRKDAWAVQDPDTGEWVLCEVYDNNFCMNCQSNPSLEEAPIAEPTD